MPATDQEKTEKTIAPATKSEVTVTLPVIGMTCPACQSHVERALRSTAGVSEASVNLLTNSARVSFDPAVSGFEELIASVRDAGYDAAPPSDSATPATDTATDEGPLRARALFTLAGGVIVMLLMNAQHWLAPVAPVLFELSPRTLEY